MLVVNATHFHTVTIMGQTYLQPLARIKLNFGIISATITAILVGVGRATTVTIALT